MTYYYYTYDLEGRAPEEYLRGKLYSAPTLDDAVRKGKALAKRNYGCCVFIAKPDTKERAYMRKYLVGTVDEDGNGRYGYIPAKSKKMYSINKDGSRGNIIESW